MPLSAPAPRSRIHTRSIEAHGFQRDDGLWDIEGRLTDRKMMPHPRRDGSRLLAAGEPIHDLSLRLTIDLDMTIHAVEAVSDATPYTMCGDVTAGFARLTGMKIGRGWNRAARALIGGTAGCTHLTELLGRVATVAFQATNSARAKLRPPRPGETPYQVDSCHTYRRDSPATRQRWPHLFAPNGGA